MNRPSRGARDSAATTRYVGCFFLPIRMRRSFTTVSLLSGLGTGRQNRPSMVRRAHRQRQTGGSLARFTAPRGQVAQPGHALLAEVGQALQLTLEVEFGDAAAGALGRDPAPTTGHPAAALALALLGVAALGDPLRADAAHPLH